jgi:hypothetical protein
LLNDIEWLFFRRTGFIGMTLAVPEGVLSELRKQHHPGVEYDGHLTLGKG